MLKSRWTKLVVFLICLAPFVRWAAVAAAVFEQPDLTRGLWPLLVPSLPPNPLDFFTHFTGSWTIGLLIATLAVTPLRKLLGIPDLIRFRRMIGLFAFFYGCLHLLTYLWFDKLFDLHEIWKDIAKRPFITAGFTAWLMMLPLALTSTKGWIRRLGGKGWQRLHRLVYISGIAAVVHYYWLVKSDVRLPLFDGALVAALLLYRIVAGIRRRAAQRAPLPPPETVRG